MKKPNSNILLIAAAIGAGIMVAGSAGSNKYKWPVKGKITSDFGWRTHPVSGKKDFHNGIDIAATNGQPLVPAKDGVVIASYYDTRGGNQVRVKHADGFTTGYAHLKSTLVKIGQKVNSNTVFAYAGKTGAVTGPHLHFTVKNPKGEAVDPKLYLPKA